MSDLNIEELKNLLGLRLVMVTFKKKDGDIREMVCTTRLNIIPESAHPKGKIHLSEETKASSIRVFDVKAQGWRSFLVDNVISFR